MATSGGALQALQNPWRVHWGWGPQRLSRCFRDRGVGRSGGPKGFLGGASAAAARDWDGAQNGDPLRGREI